MSEEYLGLGGQEKLKNQDPESKTSDCPVPDPLDLDAIRARYQHNSSGAALDIYRCLAVIEALREKLDSLLAAEQTVDDDGFTTLLWHRACREARAALALVTGGPDA